MTHQGESSWIGRSWLRKRPFGRQQIDARAARLQRRYDLELRRVRNREARVRGLLVVAIQRGHPEAMPGLARKLADVIRHRRMLEELAPTSSPGIERLILSSMMLAQSFRICTEKPEEGMHFIAGIEFDGLAIGTHIIPFPYAHRSVAGAAGERGATHKIAIETHEAKHRLLALVHSHPGWGPESNHPSSIDMRTQRLWEQGGARLVGGIWARSGELRWYSAALPLQVEVVGSHMEKIDDRLFKLVLPTS